jgi:hypothetical protein
MKKRRPGPKARLAERLAEAARITKAIRYVSRPAGDDEWLEPGKVSIWIVKHDDWCSQFKDGTCNCQPDFEVRRVDQATLDHPTEPGHG